MNGLQVTLSGIAAFVGAFSGTVTAIALIMLKGKDKELTQQIKEHPKPRIVGSVLPDWERRKVDG